MEAKYFTTDKIIAIGLVVALIIAEIIGGDTQLQNNIAIELVGFLGGKVAGKDLHGKVQENTEGK